MGDHRKNYGKRPFPNLWHKVYGHIVRQGHLLSGLPMSFDNDFISIPSGSDRRFKLYMVWFTFYNLLYVINYIPIFVWGTEDDFRIYAFYICHTLTHLCMWVLLCLIFVNRYEICALVNSVHQYTSRFNGKRFSIKFKSELF
jgi:hypothetical protein